METLWETDGRATRDSLTSSAAESEDPLSFFLNLTLGAAATGEHARNNSGSGGAISGELDLSVIERFRSNRRVNDVAFFCLVAAYCVLILLGTIGNSLVVFVVARQPAMRTARNVFVVNLAVSDLLLCLITMPLTVHPSSSSSSALQILTNCYSGANSVVVGAAAIRRHPLDLSSKAESFSSFCIILKLLCFHTLLRFSYHIGSSSSHKIKDGSSPLVVLALLLFFLPGFSSGR